MLSSTISLFLYIGTIIVGLYIDTLNESKYMRVRRIYVIWLYVFLCFGYMTGSDWRSYEMTYEYGERIDRFFSEPISWFVFTIFPKIIPDFILFIGLVKCLYLFSVYKLVSTITNRWISVLALLIPFKLCFMLVQNPFRFMMALLLVNFAFRYIYLYLSEPKKRKTKTLFLAFGLTLLSVLVHNTCVLFLPLLLISFLAPYLKKVNTFFLFILYIFFIVFTSNLSFINDLKESTIFIVQSYMEMSDYSTYESEDNQVIWSLGNMLRIVFLFFVLQSRDQICKLYKNGSIVYGFSILFLFLSRLLILIPTGFRLALPYMIFYVIMIIYMLLYIKAFKLSSVLCIRNNPSGIKLPHSHIKVKPIIRAYGLLIIMYSILSFGRMAWTSYDIIPYTNSIPYFLIGHKSYNERSQYNLNAYQDRLGVPYDPEK